MMTNLSRRRKSQVLVTERHPGGCRFPDGKVYICKVSKVFDLNENPRPIARRSNVE